VFDLRSIGSVIEHVISSCPLFRPFSQILAGPFECLPIQLLHESNRQLQDASIPTAWTNVLNTNSYDKGRDHTPESNPNVCPIRAA
jgi:hypothetical protein